MRGVEAPFQLLISVFTMVLVVAIAFHVLGTVSRERCAQQWDDGFSNLAVSIVRIGGSEYPSRDSLELGLKCGDSADHVIEIREETGALCSRICGELSDTCYILIHVVRDVRGRVIHSQPTCIKDLSPLGYSYLKRGVGSCPQGFQPLFSEDLNATLRSTGLLSLYLFRGENDIQICTPTK